MLQVKIKFRLKFFDVGWFSIFFVLLALIIRELELEDKGNNNVLQAYTTKVEVFGPGYYYFVALNAISIGNSMISGDIWYKYH